MRQVPSTLFEVTATVFVRSARPLDQTVQRDMFDDHCPIIDSDGSALLAPLVRVADSRGIAVSFQKLSGELGHAPNGGKTIAIDNTYPTGQQAKTLAHELAHCAIHFGKTDGATRLTRDIAELEAESIAYVVCSSLHVVDFGGAAVDTSSATGRLLFGITALFAEFELNQTRERTRSALAVKRTAGERIGAVPYGFDLDRADCLRHRSPGEPDDKQPCRCRLVENPSEQEIVAEIRSMRSGGMRLQAIARTLSAREAPTKTGKSGEWSHQSVARILKHAG